MDTKKLTINNLNKLMGYNVAGYILSEVKEYEDRYEIRGWAFDKMELCIIIYRDMAVWYMPPVNDCREYEVGLVKSKDGLQPKVRVFKSSFLRMSDMIGWLSDVQTEMDSW
jgi:hypothetical protein